MKKILLVIGTLMFINLGLEQNLKAAAQQPVSINQSTNDEDFYLAHIYSNDKQKFDEELKVRLAIMAKNSLDKKEIIAYLEKELLLWEQNQKANKRMWTLIIGTCVVVLGVAAGVWLWNHFKKNAQIHENYIHRTPHGEEIIISIVEGDITQQFTHQDGAAIVNAANSRLANGGGVCGSIFNAAGNDALTNECKKHPVIGADGTRCATGNAVITDGCNLAPVKIIHAVGPQLASGQAKPTPAQSAQLSNAYQNSLNRAAENKISHIAFPPISTGIYNYDIKQATPEAVQTVLNYLNANPASGIQEIRFMSYNNQKITNLYRETIEKYGLTRDLPKKN